MINLVISAKSEIRINILPYKIAVNNPYIIVVSFPDIITIYGIYFF